MPLLIPEMPSIRRRGRRAGQQPAPPAALSLVAAVYQPETWVRLTFDRAVDAAGLVPTAVTVDDQIIGAVYQGTGAATMVGPLTVQVALVPFTMSGGGGTRLLTATAGTGIVADDDGGQWAGATAVPLPFP